MEDDCFIPWHTRECSALAKTAACSADILRNGIDRGEENCWIGKTGETIEYTFGKDTPVHEIRLVFDSDLNRNYHNMPCNYPLVQTKFKLPKTLIKEYAVEGITENGQTVSLQIRNNHQRFVIHEVDWKVKTVRLIPMTTHGCEEFRVFGFEVK